MSDQYTIEKSKTYIFKLLRKKSIKNSAFLSLGNGSDKVLRLIRNMILIRLINPEIFGIMAIVTSFTALFEAFMEVGLDKSIIQNKAGAEPVFLNTVFFAKVIRALLLYAVSFISAPAIAEFYGYSHMTGLIRVVFISVILNSMMNPGLFSEMKENNFRPWITTYVSGSVLGFILCVSLAIFLRSIWILVVSLLAEALVRTVTSYIIHPYRPKLKSSKKYIGEVIQFSKGMFGIPILSYLFLRSDVFIIGKLFSGEILGFYALAINFGRMPFQFASAIIEKVLFPLLSSRKEDISALNQMICKITRIIIIWVICPLLVLIIFSWEILFITYEITSVQIIYSFILVASSEYVRLVSLPIAIAYISLGKPELHRTFSIFRLAILLPLIYPALKFWGIPGGAIVILLSTVVAVAVQFWKIKRITGLRYSDVFKDWPMLCISLMLLVVIMLFNSRMTFLNPFILAAIKLIPIGALSFLYLRRGLKIL